MAVTFSCPRCACSYRVKDRYAGTHWSCRACGGPISVPRHEPLASAPPTETSRGRAEQVVLAMAPPECESLRNNDQLREWTGASHWAASYESSNLPTKWFSTHGRATFEHPVLPETSQDSVVYETPERSQHGSYRPELFVGTEWYEQLKRRWREYDQNRKRGGRVE